MSTEEIEGGPQEGPPWKIIGRFPTFESADTRRASLLGEESLQVKVHYQGPLNNRYFAVKTRLDPRLALQEELKVKREEKKRRKTRLSKKRRKK